ncbi:MAG: hypothetical protein K6B65_03400 [Bacilli bacterium]|nr:hypothetical protein [Bacilli bacterium]
MEKRLRIVSSSSLGERASAEVPFLTGTHSLPKEGPFALNLYLGPDDGFSLGVVVIDAEKNIIYYGYSEEIDISSGFAEMEISLKTQKISVTFKVEG